MRLLVLLFCTAAAALPQAKPDVGTNVRQAVIDYYDSMSDYFRQSPRAVETIAGKGIPDEEIPAILMIARRSSMSPNQIIDARKRGQSFEAIAKQAGVDAGGQGNFIAESNVVFLSEYHGQPKEEVRAARAKGANFIEINQQYRRIGVKAKTEKSSPAK